MRTVATHRGTVACVLVIAMVSLGGCGGSSPASNGLAGKAPAQILAAVEAAVDGAATVHLSGSVRQRGMPPLSLDMELVAGKGGQGRIARGGLAFQLIEVGHFAYLKGPPAFFRHLGGAATARVLRGRWLKARTNGSFASLSGLTNLAKLVDTTLNSHGQLASNGTSAVDGQRVLVLRDPARGATLYVASVGSPYPIEVRHSRGGGRIVFDRWNQPVTLLAPGDAVNVNQLETLP